MTAAEQALQVTPHYFTNWAKLGEGIIYDQFELVENGVRRFKMSPLPIILEMPKYQLCLASSPLTIWRLARQRVWFGRDLIDMSEQNPSSSYIQEASAAYENWQKSRQQGYKIIALFKPIIRAYRVLFRHVLEKLCH